MFKKREKTENGRKELSLPVVLEVGGSADGDLQKAHAEGSDAVIPKEKILTAQKLAYYKNGVLIVTVAMSAKFYAFIFETEIGGEPLKTIICNGKLNRAVRRQLVRAGLLAFQFDYLFDAEFLNIPGVEGVRGAFLYKEGEE